MKTKPILDSVLAHLEGRITGFAVQLFPENVENYRLNHPAGAVLISYQGSGFGDIRDITFVNQDRVVELALTLITRSQWDDTGALALLDDVREAIVGFKPFNCQGAVIKSERFIDQVAGTWQYQMLVTAKTINVQHENAEKII